MAERTAWDIELDWHDHWERVAALLADNAADEFVGADAGCRGARRHRPVCGAVPTASVHRARWEHEASMTVVRPVTRVRAAGGLRSIDVMFDEIRRHRDLRHILRKSYVPSVVNRHHSSRRTHRRTDAWFPQGGFSFRIHKTTIGSSAHAWTDPGCRYSGFGDCWTWLRLGPFGPAIRERDVHAAGCGYRNAMPDLRHVRQDHHRAGDSSRRSRSLRRRRSPVSLWWPRSFCRWPGFDCGPFCPR